MSEEIYPADVAIFGERIVATGKVDAYVGPETRIIDAAGKYLCPGLIDGHLHVECSKMSITSFAKAVVPLGTTSIISGLDQILVVAGLEGARAFLDEAKGGPLKVFWGAPCKTPYTLPRSNVGHYFGPREHEATHAWPECVGIWETVREFIQEMDGDVLAALEIARKSRLPVLGCAPMARGANLNSYLAAGVRLDHESYTAEEMLEKLRNGMFVVIRESSISHFLAENLRMVTEMGISATRRISFCTDDVVAADILKRGHLDNMVRMAIAMGIPPLTAIQMATINSAEAYRIDHLVGCIAPGRIADILIVDDLRSFRVERVITNGRLVAEAGRLTEKLTPPVRSERLTRTFNVAPVSPDEIRVSAHADKQQVRALTMAVNPQQIFVRKRFDVSLPVRSGSVLADPAQDVQYVTVVERYGRTRNRPTAFVSGFGLKIRRARHLRPRPMTTTLSALARMPRTWRSRSITSSPATAARWWSTRARSSRFCRCRSAASSPTWSQRKWRCAKASWTMRRVASAAGCPGPSCTCSCFRSPRSRTMPSPTLARSIASISRCSTR